jgi:hypothetical protein
MVWITRRFQECVGIQKGEHFSGELAVAPGQGFEPFVTRVTGRQVRQRVEDRLDVLPA